MGLFDIEELDPTHESPETVSSGVEKNTYKQRFNRLKTFVDSTVFSHDPAIQALLSRMDSNDKAHNGGSLDSALDTEIIADMDTLEKLIDEKVLGIIGDGGIVQTDSPSLTTKIKDYISPGTPAAEVPVKAPQVTTSENSGYWGLPGLGSTKPVPVPEVTKTPKKSEIDTQTVVTTPVEKKEGVNTPLYSIEEKLGLYVNYIELQTTIPDWEKVFFKDHITNLKSSISNYPGLARETSVRENISAVQAMLDIYIKGGKKDISLNSDTFKKYEQERGVAILAVKNLLTGEQGLKATLGDGFDTIDINGTSGIDWFYDEHYDEISKVYKEVSDPKLGVEDIKNMGAQIEKIVIPENADTTIESIENLLSQYNGGELTIEVKEKLKNKLSFLLKQNFNEKIEELRNQLSIVEESDNFVRMVTNSETGERKEFGPFKDAKEKAIFIIAMMKTLEHMRDDDIGISHILDTFLNAYRGVSWVLGIAGGPSYIVSGILWAFYGWSAFTFLGTGSSITGRILYDKVGIYKKDGYLGEKIKERFEFVDNLIDMYEKQGNKNMVKKLDRLKHFHIYTAFDNVFYANLRRTVGDSVYTRAISSVFKGLRDPIQMFGWDKYIPWRGVDTIGFKGGTMGTKNKEVIEKSVEIFKKLELFIHLHPSITREEEKELLKKFYNGEIKLSSGESKIKTLIETSDIYKKDTYKILEGIELKTNSGKTIKFTSAFMKMLEGDALDISSLNQLYDDTRKALKNVSDNAQRIDILDELKKRITSGLNGDGDIKAEIVTKTHFRVMCQAILRGTSKAVENINNIIVSVTEDEYKKLGSVQEGEINRIINRINSEFGGKQPDITTVKPKLSPNERPEVNDLFTRIKNALTIANKIEVLKEVKKIEMAIKNADELYDIDSIRAALADIEGIKGIDSFFNLIYPKTTPPINGEIMPPQNTAPSRKPTGVSDIEIVTAVTPTPKPTTLPETSEDKILAEAQNFYDRMYLEILLKNGEVSNITNMKKDLINITNQKGLDIFKLDLKSASSGINEPRDITYLIKEIANRAGTDANGIQKAILTREGLKSPRIVSITKELETKGFFEYLARAIRHPG